MSAPSGGIPCAYCGGRHERASDVRVCWARNGDPGLEAAGGGFDDGDRDDRDDRVDLTDGGDPGGGPDGEADGPGHRSGGGARAGRVGPLPTAAGPVLGRSVLVAPGAPAPAGWERCDRLGADASLDDLEAAWRDRRPVVVELDPDVSADGPTGDGEVEGRPVWSLDPGFAFPGERRRHALFANAVDARTGTPTWPLAALAVALGARPAPDPAAADVVLADGTPARCDGGPLTWHGPLDGAAVVARTALLAGSLVPFGPNDLEAELADDQRAAVRHEGGAARIIAPAGSGKTRVLTERARHLLRRWQLPGRAVTLVAFNRRAADEMRQRTTDLPALQVRTLNALGLGILQAGPAGPAGPAGRGGGAARTIDERDVRTILDRLVDLPRRANTDPAATWIEALSSVRLGLRSPEQVEADLAGDVDGLPRVFDAYRRLLADERLVDFDDQVYGALELLLQDPAARQRARASCRVLLVDEFQDLTPAHLLLVRLLAGPDGAVFGVGDDDQTIYGYTGASPEWLVDYRRYFPSAGHHALEVNYRCPPAVVAAARTLLTHNDLRVDKRIVPAPHRPDQPGALQVVDGGDLPLEATVAAVERHLAAGVAPADLAVLARVNVALVPVQVALVTRGHPVEAAVDVGFLSRGAVQAALAWLRLAITGPDRLAGTDVAAAARRPSRALSPRLVEWMAEQRSVAGLRRLAGRLAERDGLKVDRFVTDLDQLRAVAARGTTAQVLLAVRDSVGLDAAMQLLERSRRRLEGSAQTDDLDALVALATLEPDPSRFEPFLRAALAPRRPAAAGTDAAAASPAGVTLATIHRVKGREWPHVVLHGCTAGLLPHRLASDLEEERRVFHVGITRAFRTLSIVPGDPVSPFIEEMDEPGSPGSGRRGQAGSRPEAAGSPGSRRLGADSESYRRVPKRHQGEGERPGGQPTGRTDQSSPGNGRRSSRTVATGELLPAAPGTAFTLGGHEHRVADTRDDAAVCVVGEGPAITAVPFGALVSSGGKPALLGHPGAGEAWDKLRTWRSTRSKELGIPPFVVFDDKTLRLVAAQLPLTEAALLSISGIGPVKAESYGTELLAVCEAVRDSTSDRQGHSN
ncbi:MAG: ATP-dependent DNA helicase UvrD2 [Actinomycetota bacterium]|nr:ATP-dependent DNA helicase UvrD2 [Actinomycetota bacterium]